MERDVRFGARIHSYRYNYVARVRELDGIARQIQNDLTQPVRIADHHLAFQVGIEKKLQAVCMSARRDGFEGFADAFQDIELDVLQIQFPSLDFGKIEDVVDHGQHGVGRRSYRLQIIALLLCEHGSERQFRHAYDAVHRCPDLMAHVRQKFALGAAGRLGPLFRLAQFDFRTFQLRDVVTDSMDKPRTSVGPAHHLRLALEPDHFPIACDHPVSRFQGLAGSE